MRLLVCLDFDGTLAELNPDPYAVRIHPAAEAAIRRLAALPDTCLLYTSPSPRDKRQSRMPSSA